MSEYACDLEMSQNQRESEYEVLNASNFEPSQDFRAKKSVFGRRLNT